MLSDELAEDRSALDEFDEITDPVSKKLVSESKVVVFSEQLIPSQMRGGASAVCDPRTLGCECGNAGTAQVEVNTYARFCLYLQRKDPRIQRAVFSID